MFQVLSRPTWLAVLTMGSADIDIFITEESPTGQHCSRSSDSNREVSGPCSWPGLRVYGTPNLKDLGIPERSSLKDHLLLRLALWFP